MLAEAHQKIVVFDPVLLGKLCAQRDLGFLRRFRFDVAPAIRNSMHVGVDADAGFFVAEGDDQIGGLAPDAFELQQLVDFVGNFAAV